MNKAQLKKSIGVRVKLRPVPVTRDGQPVDHDWILRAADDAAITLDEPIGGFRKILGTDHIYSFYTDPSRDIDDIRHGFLQLHSQLILDGIHIHIEPLPHPRAPSTEPAVHPSTFTPLVVDDAGKARYFSWRPRDPLHLIRIEEPARQLFKFFIPLCDRLRAEGHEPHFNRRDKIRGEPVYELSPDFKTKWRLLGGAGGTGDQVLVLMPNDGSA